ncbi:hypothetical protein F4776DRAFT_208056 [Hypoxylon sp. NC0597]|nr:hypothetical protein F4776DRAFT_208056 [Hypoxylon sp. NC0597]
MEKATSRLRRTFAYPADDDDNDAASPSSSAEVLDEQEQENLIASLAQQNEARNAQFRLLLLCLPAVSALPYLVALVFPRSNGGGGGSDRLTALLSLTSLASTAWMLWAQAPGVTGIRVLDAWVSGAGASPGSGSGRNKNAPEQKKKKKKQDRSVPFWAEEHRRSPLEKYLPYLNLGICAVLVMAGFLSKSAASQGHWGHVGLSNLPAIVYGVVLVAKMVMGSVDPERDLGALRYEYKGA